MANGGRFHERVLDHYDAMPRGERRLADLLLKAGGSIRNESATALAEAAGISKATAARFFKRLGYPSFKEAQKAVRVESAAGRAPEQAFAAWRDEAGGPSLSAHLDAEVQNLIRTVEQQRSDEISSAVRLLGRAEKLWVVGFGDNYPLAHFARSLLIKIRPDVRMIPIGGFSVPEEFASISSSDVMLAFAVGRRTRALRNITSSASRAGAEVILVTDAAWPADVQDFRVTLRCRSVGAAMFDSMAATVSLMTFLCASLAARIGDPAIERLRVIENIHADWGEGVGVDV